ncbi:MAG: helix-turn-helix domain-containing protein [Solirubrobacteraceae bacterium]
MSAYATNPATARSNQAPVHVSGLLEDFISQLAEQVAARLAGQVSGGSDELGEWLDSRHAAEYLGIHRDTLRKLAAERAIPCEQDGPGCKLYFRRTDLDAWRQGGGRPRHLALVA